MAILTVNAGSSSIRLALFAADASAPLAQAHHVDKGLGVDEMPPAQLLAAFLRGNAAAPPTAAVHRIVHGGERLTAPCRIDAGVRAEIERLAPLAPLHNPVALRWYDACVAALGADVPQVAVFDTAFYNALPAVARTYALPQFLRAGHGIRRYGFHGLAHAAMWQRWRRLEPSRGSGRVISFQLGAGCSVTAIAHGRAIDTSMGFTPLEGLVMATRCGDLDPGIAGFVQKAEALSPAALENLLTHESGLRGLAGDGDMRALLARDDAAARAAIEIYCYRARKYIGAYMAALGGVDAVLFGGGVGENAAAIRSLILAPLAGLGFVLDEDANARVHGDAAKISAAGSRVALWVIPTDEAAVMAALANEVVAASQP